MTHWMRKAVMVTWSNTPAFPKFASETSKEQIAQTFQMFAEVTFQIRRRRDETRQQNNPAWDCVPSHDSQTGANSIRFFLTQNTNFAIQQKLHFCPTPAVSTILNRTLSELLLPSGWRRLRSRPSGSGGLLLVPCWCWYIHKGLQGQSTTYVRPALWLTLQCTYYPEQGVMLQPLLQAIYSS